DRHGLLDHLEPEPAQLARDELDRRPLLRRPRDPKAQRVGAKRLQPLDDKAQIPRVERPLDELGLGQRASLRSFGARAPPRDDELALGRLQAIFFCELDGPRSRSLYVTIL